MTAFGVCAFVLCLAVPRAAARSIVVDRAVVRFVASETGGTSSPRFIFERVLAFEARLEALTDPAFTPTDAVPYRQHHVRAAMERHIAETLLESLEIRPEPSQQEMLSRINSARLGLAQRAGGIDAVRAAARAEGIAESEHYRLLRRQARASLYLDRMVAPMLSPSEAELRSVHRSGRTPYSARPLQDVKAELRRWYIGLRLKAALAAFYEGARARVRVDLLARPGTNE